MKRFRPIPLAATLWLAWTLGACAGEAPDHTPDAASEEAEAAPGPEVEYEPAYPEEVSPEGLSEADEAQQETHTHGGTTHSHGDDEGDEHEHDDGSH